MIWHCQFTWQPGTTTERVRTRVLQQHAAGTNHPEKIRGWYNFAGGGKGLVLIETEDSRELNGILEPYMDLVSWDVHAVYELPYDAVAAHFREMIQSAGKSMPVMSMPGSEWSETSEDGEAVVDLLWGIP